MKNKQLCLNFPVNEKDFSSKTFFISKSNKNAINWIYRWPAWPNGICIIIGEPMSGKTHISKIWQKKSKAITLENLADFETYIFSNKKGHILIENIEKFFNSNENFEQNFLHIINIQNEIGCSILITSNISVKNWKIIIPDLRSRVNSFYYVKIDSPDDDFIKRYISSLFEQRQINVPEKVINDISFHLPRNFALINQLVSWIDVQTIKKKVSLTLVKDFFSNKN